MKNTFKYASLALLGALMALACNKTVEEPTQEPANEPVMRTFTCTIGDPDSKVDIDTDGKTSWEVDDEILIHGEYMDVKNSKKYSTIVKLKAGDISADGKTATISFATDPDGVSGIVPYTRADITSEFYAAYPASSVKQVSGHHCYYYSIFTDCSKPLLAGYNKGDSFIFYNLGSVITFSVPNTEDFDSYVLMGESGETVSYDQFSIKAYWASEEYEDYKLPYTSSDEYTQTSCGSWGEQTSISGSVTCDGSLHKVFIPNGVNFTGGFRINFIKGGDLKKYVSVKAVDLRMSEKKGRYLNLGDISSYLKTYVPPATHDATNPAITGATPLDGSASANCYIVDGSDSGNANKVFKFKAYKGNSTTNVGAIASVDVLWETYNNDQTVTKNSIISAVDFDKQEANAYYEICFKMPATLHAGNAVIAAKNSGGTILWSWHIWVPSTSISSADYGIYTAGKNMMDRNLGALEAAATGAKAKVESFGLLYQWGRKDPFPGAKRVDSGSRALVAGVAASSTDGDGNDNDDSKITLEQSIANPTLLGHRQGKDWVTPSDMTLWKDSEKTIYDPCPPGYRVPARNKSTALHSDDLSIATGWEDNATNLYATLGSPVAVFPYTGYYDTWSSSLSGISSTGKRTVLWTAYSSSAEIAYETSIRTASESGGRHKLEEVGKCNTSSVRCVAE